MNESIEQLNEIKKEIIKKALYHYRVGDLKKDIDNLDFDNKRHIQLILRKYRTFENIIDSTKKALLNQMVVSFNQIPNVIIESYYMPKETINPFKKKEYYIDKEEEDLYIKAIDIIGETTGITGMEDLEDEKMESIDINKKEEISTIEEISMKKKRPKYYCNDCKYNHFYDSKKGKEHKLQPIFEQELEPQILKTLFKEGNERIKEAKEFVEFITKKIQNEIK